VTDDKELIKAYRYYEIPSPEPPNIIEHVPQVKIINPITKKSAPSAEDDLISDEYYLKRHRKHEMDEKKQKNREKERLRHGYYQQKQLVERIKTMDKSLLQSIVSSIRHRTHKDQEEEESTLLDIEVEEETYLEELHDRLLRDALEHLKRYEVLGLSNNKDIIVEEDPLESSAALSQSTSAIAEPSQFQKAIKTEAKKQRERQIKSFSGHPAFVGNSNRHQGTRRSTRRVLAFGQRLPEFDTQEFVLPSYIVDQVKR
jgi:hypothetical protein